MEHQGLPASGWDDEMAFRDAASQSPDTARPWAAESAEQALQETIRYLSTSPVQLSCCAGLRSGELGGALVFRIHPARSLLIIGATAMAAELRRLTAAGAAPGWDLHPVPDGHTPLHALAAPLLLLSGSNRYYNLLDRSGFAYVEEVAAAPDICLLGLRNAGTRFVATVRQATRELDPAPAAPGHIPRSWLTIRNSGIIQSLRRGLIRLKDGAGRFKNGRDQCLAEVGIAMGMSRCSSAPEPPSRRGRCRCRRPRLRRSGRAPARR